MSSRYFFAFLLLSLISFISGAAYAAGCGSTAVAKLDLSDPLYSGAPAIDGVSIYSDFEIRTAAISQAVGRYVIANGLSSLRRGNTIKVTYREGTSECAEIGDVMISVRAVPIPGTQHDPSAQTGSGGPGDGGGSSSGGYYQYRYWMVCYDTAMNGSYNETTCYKES